MTTKPLHTRIDQSTDRFHNMLRRLSVTASTQTSSLQNKLDALDRMLATLGYEATLKRGYVVVRSEDQVVTTRAAAAQAGALEIQFADGRLSVAKTAGKKTPKADTPPDQGSLF